MLTKSDFIGIKKIVRDVVREEVENETQSLKHELQADITHARIRIQSEIGELKDRIKNLEIRVTKMHKELKEEIKLVTGFLDKENIKTLKRVEALEEHLGLTAS